MNNAEFFPSLCTMHSALKIKIGIFLKRVLTWQGRCGNIYGNKAEVTASHLKRNAAGVNNLCRKSTGDLFECGEIAFHRIFCFV